MIRLWISGWLSLRLPLLRRNHRGPTALAVAFFARVTGTTRVFTAAYTAMAPDMPGAADTARAVDTLLVPDMDMAVGVATGNDAPLARVAVRG